MTEPMLPKEAPVQPARPRRASMNVLGQLSMVFTVGAVLATLFTAWTPLGLFPTALAEQVASWFSGDPAAQGSTFPTPTARPRPRIGIVAGHWGGSDPGAVCSDGLTEVEITLNVATRVKEALTAAGFDVDLLEEFDDRLAEYEALALVSIHVDTCAFIDDNATGFKVTAALASVSPEKASRLVACLRSRYQEQTGLRFHSGSVTPHMSSYHAFDEIHSETTAAIMEIGFMNLDRQILTQQPDVLAQGIANGILCFIYNEDASPAEGQQ